MKVAFYAPLKAPTHPVPSGDRTIARDLWENFSLRGHDCLLLSEFRSRWFYQTPLGWARAAAHLASAAARAARFKPDIFFTYHNYYKAPDPIGPALSLLRNRPYVLYEASHAESPRRRPATAPGYYLTRGAIGRAAHVFSNMTDDAPELRRLLPSERLSIVVPAVDCGSFRPDPAARERWRRKHGVGAVEPLVACVAMLRGDRKAAGVRFLIETLGELRRAGHRPRFALAGGGESFDEIKRLAEGTLNGNGASLLLGPVGRGEVAELLRAADVFAFPGIDEGFGLVYLEAQASGLPVVAFRDGGVPDAVEDGATGLLTPPMDRAAYARALASLFQDPALRGRMGEAARRRMTLRHHTRDNYGAVVRRCEEIVESWRLSHE